MLQRLVPSVAILGMIWLSGAHAAEPTSNDAAATWRPTNASTIETLENRPDSVDATAVVPVAHLNPGASLTDRGSTTRTSSGVVGLPNDMGQVWREYDISPYTARVTSTKRPEQAIIDWILRETGYETWHGESLAILNADRRVLRIYHTPQMQRLVADLVERFVDSQAGTYTFSLRLVTLDSPSWRASAQAVLRPVPVQAPGANAWLLAKEDAAMLLGELRRRDDYREHSSPYLMVNNGQSTVISSMRGRSYVRDVTPRPDSAAGFEPTAGQVDEGFTLDFSPLLSVDRKLIDATIKCEIDQVEKMIPVMIDVPTKTLTRQRAKLETPQMTHYRFHERFRWPVDQMLLVGLGMVALPMPVDGRPLVPGLPLPFGSSPPRADLLIFVECRSQTAAADNAPYVPASNARANNYRGRY